jgi:hypothetical protein
MANFRQDLLHRVRRVLSKSLLDDSLIVTEHTKMSDIPE